MTACPPADDLRRLLSGRLPVPAYSAIEIHIEGCAHCQQTLEELTGEGDDSTLTMAPPEPWPDSAVARRLHELPPPQVPPTPPPEGFTALRRSAAPVSLLLRRLRVMHATSVLVVGYMLAVCALGLYEPMGPAWTLAAEGTFDTAGQILLAVIVVLLTASAGLMAIRGRRLSEAALRWLDLAGFLGMGVLLSYWQFRLLTVAPPGGFDSPGFEGAWQFYAITNTMLMWVVVLTAEGLFIPQSPRRCAALMAAAIATSAAVSVAAALVSPAAARVVPGLLLEVTITLSCTAVLCISAAVRVRALERTAHSAVGPYTLRERLGTGGMGEVWLAEHRLLKRPCAVKLVRAERAGDPAALRRFEREVQATSRLRHPNIVEIYDYGLDDDGAFFYVMEHLPGLSLDRLVGRHGPLPASRAIHLLRQLCAALREAHAAGLVHRDLKPGNVFVCDRGPPDCVKLLDFGLVRSVGESDAFSTLTGEGQWSGTPAYMAPEQISKGVVDGRTDLYALGAVAYFMLTGRELFPRDNVLLTLTAHLREPPEPPSAARPGLPADLEAVVLRCLSKAPGDRYGSALDLDRALARCVEPGQWTEDEAASWWREPGITWSGKGTYHR